MQAPFDIFTHRNAARRPHKYNRPAYLSSIGGVRLLHNGLHPLFKILPGQQNIPAAAQAFNAKVHANFGDFPVVAAAGVRFFQIHHVAHCPCYIFQISHIPHLRLPFLVLVIFRGIFRQPFVNLVKNHLILNGIFPAGDEILTGTLHLPVGVFFN